MYDIMFNNEGHVPSITLVSNVAHVIDKKNIKIEEKPRLSTKLVSSVKNRTNYILNTLKTK